MHPRRSRSIVRALVALTTLASSFDAPAAAQSLDLTQYVHTSWYYTAWGTAELGTMVQTPDGYLWGASHDGLYRFDGVRFTKWQSPVGEQLPSTVLKTLTVTRDGTLLIATQKGLLGLRDGKLTRYGIDKDVWSNVLERADGTIWFQLGPRTLCTIRDRAA